MRNSEVAMAFNTNSSRECNTMHFFYTPQRGERPKGCVSYSMVIALGEYKSYNGMSNTTATHLGLIQAKPLWGAFKWGDMPTSYQDLARNIAMAFKRQTYSLNMNRKECREEYRAMLKAYNFMMEYRPNNNNAEEVIERYTVLYGAWKEKHKERANQEKGRI